MTKEVLYVFDFDGTLINTGNGDENQKAIYKKKTGKDWAWSSWWDIKESLNTSIFTHTPILDVIDVYNSVVNTPNAFVVMLTGRKNHLKDCVEAVLNENGITYFDRYMYNYGGNTLVNKKEQIFKLINEYPSIQNIIMYDDRVGHVSKFKSFGDDLIKLGFITKFNIYQVKNGKII
jgi:hypothetical protein